MPIYIHVLKKKRKKLKPSGKKCTFMEYKVSHMEIDCKKQKAPKMTIQDPYDSFDHSSYH
jgi:hypothetical protein